MLSEICVLFLFFLRTKEKAKETDGTDEEETIVATTRARARRWTEIDWAVGLPRAAVKLNHIRVNSGLKPTEARSRSRTRVKAILH